MAGIQLNNRNNENNKNNKTKKETNKRIIIKSAIYSRLFVLMMSVVLGSILNVPDYDSSSNLPLSVSPSFMDEMIYKIFGRFLKWDAVYYTRIAEYGYEYEQFYAFFPFFPLVMRYFSKVILLVLWWITERSAIILAGFIISNVCFVISAVQLYKLGCVVLRDESMAFISTILYTITPASIFMSAIYTESIYALLVFSSLYYLTTNKFIFSLLSFFCATFTRSNGILLCGFIIFRFFFTPLLKIFTFCASLLPSKTTTSKKGNFTQIWNKISSEAAHAESGYGLFTKFLLTAIFCLTAVAPFYGYQYYAKLQFCSEDPSARPYCDKLVPNLYSFVQTHYWNQGLFHYYELKQIPNFLLAGPMVILSFCGIFVYLKNRIEHIQEIKNGIEKTKLEWSPYFDPQVLPYILYWAAILVFSLSYMHVQVITRFFSSCPPVYWFCSFVFSFARNRKRVLFCFARKLILGYFLLYLVLGTSLFVLFYPWT